MRRNLMSQDNDPSNKGNISAAEDSSQLIKNVTVYDNLDQNLIRITEDKLENILLKHLKNIQDEKAWITPFGVLLTLIFIPITTEKFKDSLSIDASVWGAACYIGIVISLVWTLYSVYRAYSCKGNNLEGLINKIKKSGNSTHDKKV